MTARLLPAISVISRNLIKVLCSFVLLISAVSSASAQQTNRPPVAVADSYTGVAARAQNAPGLLANDSDPDGDPLTTSAVSPASHGTINVGPYGNFSYSPTGGYTGTDSFVYKACDPSGACSTATVTVHANDAPNAAADSYPQAAAARHQDAPGLLANDSDPNGDSLTAVAVTSVSHGYLSFGDYGNFSYSPTGGFIGTDSFIYKACDNFGACTNATVTLHGNDAPNAVADSYTGVAALHQDAPGLLANDSDPNGDSLTTAAVTSVTHGYLIVGDYGNFSYSPASGFSGTDSFVYKTCDNFGACNNATVTLFVTNSDDVNAGTASCPMVVAKPINVTNGNMYLQQTDYNLPGVGENINLTRTYNSLIQTSGWFGFGWSTQYDENVTLIDNQMLRVSLADGRAVYFGRTNTAAPFTSLVPDFYGQVVKNADNTFTLTFKDGRVHQFNTTGRLTLLKDVNGNQTALAYNAANQLIKITDPFGRILTVSPVAAGLNGAGNVGQLNDAVGIVATYVYNSDNTLQSVTYPDNSKYKFTYTTVNFNGVNLLLLTTVKDAYDNILEMHAYEGQGRATTSERQGGVEKVTLDYSNPGYTQVTDALGRVTKYYVDKSRGRNVVTKVEGNCGCGSGAQVTNYQYDAQLNLIKKTDALGHDTTYTYDTLGNHLTMIDVLGTETYTYNALGEVLTAKDRMYDATGVGLTTNTYDPKGNLLTTKDALNYTTTFTYTALGQLKTIKDARNNVTTLAYDTTGRLSTVTDADSKVTTYGYDARARVTSVKNALNETTTIGYDLNNRLNKITYPDTKFVSYGYDLAGRRTTMTDPRGKITTYGYDGAYRLTTITDPLTHVTTFGYDLMSNRTSVKDALNQITDYEFDDYNRLKRIVYPPSVVGGARLDEKLEYDGVGNVKKRIDTAARQTLYDYDAANRLQATTDPDLKVTQFEYNNRSQMTKVTDALTQVYNFSYDPLGRLLSQTRAGSTMTFQYDPVGNRINRTDYIGRPTAYTYDTINRLKTIQYLQPTPPLDNIVVPQPPTLQTTYNYDALSRLSSAVNQTGTVSFTYDTRGRMATTTDVWGKVLTYGYDNSSNRNLLKLDGTNYASYGYDDANRLTSLTNSSDNAVINFGYDNANRLTSRNYPNSVATTYNYDGMSRLTRLKDTGTSVNLDRQYAYNAANQIDSITEPSLTRFFGYDSLNRVTAVTPSTGTAENYAFDAVGNRTSSQRSSSYTYQPFNRLTATATTNYVYDSNGNMTQKEGGSDKHWRYSWDYENRMTEAWNGKVRVRYWYDALGRRVARNAGPLGVTKFTYDGQDVILDQNADGTTVKYLNGQGIDNKLRQTTGTTAQYFLSDHLGSTNALVDASGAITSQTAYDAFGNQTSTLATRYGYTGRERDDATGLMYYRARQYSPDLGRFISEDPIGFKGGDINLYGYVWNNPVNYFDPRGLDGWGNDTADWLDERIEFARKWYQPDEQDWWTNGVNNSVANVAFGTSNWLRVGNGTAQAFCDCDENIYGRAAFVAMDVERAAGIFTFLGGIGVRFAESPTGCSLNQKLYEFSGREAKFGNDFRIAPFGNRTGHPQGKYPHYHRRGKLPNGQTKPGQGIGRHRPWETKSTDTSPWDRF